MSVLIRPLAWRRPLRPQWRRPLTLAGQYNLASLLVLLVSMVLIGCWVGTQIRDGVIHRTAATTALYVENFLVTQLQELGQNPWLPRERITAIEQLLATTPLGREIVSVKIWAPGGRVVYGEDAGQVFAVKEDQRRAWAGEVSSEISDLSESENASQRGRFSRLIETYAPMRIEGSERVIAVAEFYQTVGPLDHEILVAQQRSWAMVALATLLTYLILSGVVRRGSDTIARQQVRLREQVETLETVLAQNSELHGRVSRAAARNAAHSERFLMRVSSDLHDGPAQDLSFALLRLESLAAYTGQHPEADRTLRALEGSLTSALREMRAIATDLRLPDLEPLDLREVLERAVRDHRRRSAGLVSLGGALPNVTVTVSGDDLGQGMAAGVRVPLPVKITAFRIVQEALNNAHRHAPGAAVEVSASARQETLLLSVCDSGPGFTWTGVVADGHLGLVGMRERAESLGGTFSLQGRSPGGTCIEARLPLASDALDHSLRDADV
ncbi:sensor histidine kinase [Deinococcus sp. UYEF24]